MQEANGVRVDARIFKSKELIGSFEVKGESNDLDMLVDAIIGKAREMIQIK